MKLHIYPNIYNVLAPSQFGNSGSGTITGLFGVCNNNDYKIQQFSKKFGIYYLIYCIIVRWIFIVYTIKTK